MASPLEDVSLSSILRYGRDRLGRIAGEVPNEVAANLRDLADAGKFVVGGMAGRREPFIDDLKAQMRARQLRGDDQSSMTETPFGTRTSGDPAVKAAGMALDPLNFAGAGVVKGKAIADALKKAKRGLVNLKLREKTPEEALALAQSEAHLIEGGKGSEGLYVGGPRNIETRAQLTRNRRRMDAELGAAVGDIERAGEIPGDWYPSMKRAALAVSDDPKVQRRAAESRGLFSPQTDPEGETGFMLQAWNRLARGEPVGVARTRRQGREFEQSALEDRPMKLGEKTAVYATHGDPTAEVRPFVGTNDFRQAQFQGYTDPSGKPQTTGLKPTQHAFMDAEQMLLTQRAKAKALGGRTDWTPDMAQEVPWVVEKANSLQKRFPGRFPKTPEGRAAAIQEASKTGEDYLTKHAVGATYERVPGGTTGQDPQIFNAPYEERAAYSALAPWTDPGGRDVIYGSQGLLQLPTVPGTGYWQGKTAPNFIAQPLGDIETKIPGTKKSLPAGRELSPGMLQSLALSEHLRGLVDVQDAAAFHLPMTQKARKLGTKQHALLEHEGQLSEPEMRALAEQLPEGWSPTASPRGTMLMQFDKPSSAAAKDVAAMQDTIAQGQLPLQRAGMESDLLPIYSEDMGPPLPQGQGIVTRRFLERAAETPPTIVEKVSGSKPVREAIRGVTRRDIGRAAEGATIRPDVQKTRQFLSEDDWGRVAALMREKGIPAAAAMAALGYSLSGMAADEVPR